MSARPWPRRGSRATFCLLMLLASASVHAQGLAIRNYDITDGLPNSRVVCLLLDHRGFLWIGTWEGVSRFDGTEFVNYGAAHGLTNPVVNSIAEAPDGTLWVATNGGGVARMSNRPGTSDDAAALFTAMRLSDDDRCNVVISIAFDRAGHLWCATDHGLFACAAPGADQPEFAVVLPTRAAAWSQATMVDQEGALWCGMLDGVARIQNGVVDEFANPPVAELGPVAALLSGLDSPIVAFEHGLFERDVAARTWRSLDIELPPAASIRGLLRDSSGDLWIATNKGLVRRRGGTQSIYTTAQRLSDNAISALCEDRDHNIWIGTWSAGLCKLSGDALVSFTTRDGMPERVVTHLAESRSGSIVACTFHGVAEVRDDRVRVVPGSLEPPFARLEMSLAQDRRGDWWLGTSRGVYRFQGPELQLERGELMGPEQGIARAAVYGRIYEDPDGVIWVSTVEPRLYWYDPRASEHVRFEHREVMLGTEAVAVRTYLRDPSGTLWLAPIRGLLRLRGDALARVALDGFAADEQIRSLRIDHRGWLWLGSRYCGVACCQDYRSDRLAFQTYSTRTGLSSDACWEIAEDRLGRMYCATSRGVERLDPESGEVHHYSSADGLAGDIVNDCLSDRDGNLWFGTSGGLSRLTPHPVDPPVAPPPIYITRIQLAGEDLALPETGTAEPAAVTLPSHRNSVAIQFAGVSFRGEHQLYYQYRLASVDAAWSPRTTQRSVHYARLAPGDYAFEVRAVHASGVSSPAAAAFRFRILPPIYLRWWFVAAVATALAGLGVAWHRLRVQRIVALESIRRQIATDIHDDLGSGLAQIAILAEVVKRDTTPATRTYLEQVAQLARSMRESMSDIVWSVDPRKDRFADLVQRMRQVAFNLFESEGVRVDFHVPRDESFDRTGLPPDRRRHLFLIFKEALANAARHAHAGHVTIELALDRTTLRLCVHDDGCGFDADAVPQGHGMQNLRQRAAALGGRLQIHSTGAGTTVELSMPL